MQFDSNKSDLSLDLLVFNIHLLLVKIRIFIQWIC